MKVLVTGASGFIGSAFVRDTVRRFPGVNIVGLYRHSQSQNLKRLEAVYNHAKLNLVNVDLTGDISGICEGVDMVVNFAARTFVDHSIRHPEPFLTANVLGAVNMLEEARRQKVKRFIQISTDEVYGSIAVGAYKEDAPINPSNPYAASKASADAWAISYANTYGMHVTVTRTENNYGPWQHPQKAMPVFVRHAMADQPLPVYGDGQHIRQWMHVDDHVDAVWHLLDSDIPPGQIYHIAGRREITNLELATRVLEFFGKPRKLIQHIDDHNIRPGHDRRYALNCSRINDTGWSSRIDLDKGLSETFAWYRDHPEWLGV
jgi:dTDP-glucose 4,6-dehydratase